MTIRSLRATDIPACAEILRAVYNNELWQCRWDQQTAEAYLREYMDARRFVSFALEDGARVIGAVFAHEKTWWNNSEMFIDEMFVLPEHQHQGLGHRLLERLEAHVREKGLAGFTLTTNRYSPAPRFYQKNGFAPCEHILYMAKEISSPTEK